MILPKMLLVGNVVWLALFLQGCTLVSGQSSTTPSETTPTTLATTLATPTPTEKKTICHAHPQEQGPPLPLLNEQFEMTVEATIKQKNHTLTMELHYDFPNNQASFFISRNGVQSRLLYNFPRYEKYFIQDNDCITTDLRKERGFQLINYTVTDKGAHVSNVSDLFNFGVKYNETYVDSKSTVRGMPVDQWTSCVDREGITFRLDYFFTKQNYSSPSGLNPVPVRAVLTSVGKTSQQNTKDQHFEHIYDFVTYKPGPCQDPSFFRVPQGSVCNRAKTKKTQPTLPDHFSVGVEVIQPKLISFSKQYFDYAANLTRTDITPSKKAAMTLFGNKYGYRPLKVIHDYSTGIQYVVDVLSENCSMRAIPNNSVDARVISTDPSHVHMRHGADMFWLSTHDLIYQGQRTVREITCDVWSAVRPDWLKGVNATMESCWAPRSQIGGLSSDEFPEQMVLVQIWLHSYNKTTNYSSTYISNMFNFDDDKPDLSLFDIGNCFPKSDSQMHIIFRLPGSLQNVLRHQPRHLKIAVRDAVSKAARISPIRVNNFLFKESPPDFVDVWMTIYKASDVKGNVDRPVPQLSLDGAYKALEKVINSEKGLTIQLVSDTGSKVLRVVQRSLKRDKDMYNPYCTDDRCDKGHSSGSMAALGIMMLILGVVLGLVGAFFLWKRGTGIPYQVQD